MAENCHQIWRKFPIQTRRRKSGKFQFLKSSFGFPNSVILTP